MHHAFPVFLVVLTIAQPLLGAKVFFDDFNDGSVTDGSPVSWTANSAFGGGTIDVVTGDLLMTPTQRFVLAIAEHDSLSNVSMRARIRMLQPSETDRLFWEFVVRGDLSTGLGYLGGIGESGNVYIRRTDTVGAIVLLATDLRPLEEDVVLQFDVIGAELRMWAWRPSETMPIEPVVSTVENSLTDGLFGFIFGSANEDASSRSAAVRYVAVANTHIVPEPRGLAIAATCLIVLLVARHQRFRSLRSRHP